MAVDESKLEEYKILKHEIDQNQRDGIKLIEFGLTASAALLGVAFSTFMIPEWRWLFLFTPWIVLTPITMLMAQRVRQTWKIGRYIQYCLEPSLGLNWERINFEGKIGYSKGRRIIPYVWGTTGPLFLIQLFCPIVSLMAMLSLPKAQENLSYMIIWAILTIILIITFLMQVNSINQANHPERYSIIKIGGCDSDQENGA